MKRIAFASLLLLIAIAGMTQCLPQTDLNKICLTPKQFDFYANALVERNSLKVDTSLLRSKILSKDIIISQLEKKQIEDGLIMMNQIKIIDTYTKSYDDLHKGYMKEKKKNKKLKQTSLVLSMVSCILAAILIIK